MDRGRCQNGLQMPLQIRFVATLLRAFIRAVNKST